MDQWKQDLSLAAEHQEMVRLLLDSRTSHAGWWVTSEGYEPNQDLIFRYRCSHDGDVCEHLIECKEDFKCYKTGNLAVEVSSQVKDAALNRDEKLSNILSQRPSGMTRTRAQSVVYTSHLNRPGAPHQAVEGEAGVWCEEVTWRMTPVALLKSIENWGKNYSVWRVDTTRDPEHTASCHIVEHANTFIDEAQGLVVLDTAPCRHPWRHYE